MTMEKIKVVADFDWLENEETIGLLGHVILIDTIVKHCSPSSRRISESSMLLDIVIRITDK